MNSGNGGNGGNGGNEAADDTPARERQVFCNRTLNLRSIRAVGYDMDYTLVHYRAEEWEGAAFDHARRLLALRGWPVDELRFDPAGASLGLAYDLELGNLIKATRFGYVIRAAHGTEMLSFGEVRRAYAGVIVDLAEPRFGFMNTLFSLSEANLYAQLVDLLDAGRLPVALGYADLYATVGEVLEETHTEGELKARIVADPDRFVDLDPDLVLTLEDQRQAGKLLVLVTNSDWDYTRSVMAYTVDRFLPAGRTWRDLFDVVIVSAAKPAFFAGRAACYRLVDEDTGVLLPHRGPLERGGVYVGGDASRVEESLGLSGSEILYLGDHLFGDVHVSKAMLRWRTGLILRELEAEIRAVEAFGPTEAELSALMAQKAAVDRELARLRLRRLRGRRGYGVRADGVVDTAVDTDRAAAGLAEIDGAIRRAAARSAALDERIAPLASAAATVGSPNWGPLLRAGNDKSLFARQIERYADIYTSRVSNLGAETPFAYLRAARSNLPHDPEPFRPAPVAVEEPAVEPEPVSSPQGRSEAVDDLGARAGQQGLR